MDIAACVDLITQRRPSCLKRTLSSLTSKDLCTPLTSPICAVEPFIPKKFTSMKRNAVKEAEIHTYFRSNYEDESGDILATDSETSSNDSYSDTDHEERASHLMKRQRR